MYMDFTDFFQNHSAKVYTTFIVLLYVMYSMAFLGIYYVNPVYTHYLNAIIHIFVAFVLIYRFNPFTKVSLSESDHSIIFTAGCLLFLNTGITEYIYRYVDSY